MKNIEEFMNSLGGLAEMTTIFYQALVHAGLSEDIALTLTVKMIHEIAVASLMLSKSEDSDESE